MLLNANAWAEHWAARCLQAQPEPEGVGDEEWCVLKMRLWEQYETVGYQGERFMYDADFYTALDVARQEITRHASPTIEPVPVAERFEFSVFNSEYEEQAGGTAPTYAEALGYGQHYLSQYSQDGPHSLEIRRVEVLPHHALPLPTPTP
jgi:hypothetical protein